MPGRRPLGLAALGLVLACGFLLLTASPASAHAVLVGSSPADGAVLGASPARVLLHFSEAVQLRPGGVRVLDVHGVAVNTGDARLGPTDTVTVDVRPGLPDGTYLVSWRVVSDDSHPVTGGLLFGVGTAPSASSASPALQAATPGGDEVLDVLAGLARGVGYAGMALAVGATAFLVLVGPARGRRGAVGRLPIVGLVALATGTVLQFAVQGAQAGGDGIAGLLNFGDLADTAAGPLGPVLAARGLLIVVAAVSLVRLLDGRPVRRAPIKPVVAGVAVCTGVGLAVTVALSGHARSGPALAVLSWTVHVLAMSVWLGGLAVLAVLTGRGRDRAVDSGLLVRLPTWSRMAQASVALLAVTGAYQVWRQTDGLHSVTMTAYGRLLMIKLAFVGVMLAAAMAGYAWLRRRYTDAAVTAAWEEPASVAHPAPPDLGTAAHPSNGSVPGPPRWWLRVELVAGLLVLAITAALVGQVPATSVTRSAAVPSGPTFDDRAPAGPFTVLVHVAPAGLGPEEVTVRVVDSAGGSVAVEHVAGRLALPERDLGPFQVRFLPGGSGEFTGKTLVVLPGRWELTLSVQLDALTDYVTLSSYDVR